MTGKQKPQDSKSPFGLASRVGGEDWNYVSNTAMVFAVLNTVLNGVVVGHFYGLGFGAFWTVIASVLLVAMIQLSLRISKGAEHLSVPAMACNVALVALWVAGAILMWQTKHATAMVMSTTMVWSWIMHILLAGQRNRAVMAFTMGMPAVALIYFLISAAWIDYPFWIAVAGTVAALMMMAALAQSAKTAHDNFNRVQTATGEAKAMRSKLEFAIESVGDGYFEINLDTLAYTPNPKFAESLGFAAGSHDAHRLEAWIHPDDIGLCSQNLRECRHGEADGWDQDVRVMDAAGKSRWMAMRARVLMADGGERLLIGTLVDLTARKQLEADMLAAKEAAIASAKAKGEFLANMSHEIRTPLNGVLGMAQALEQGGSLAQADREKVSVILDSGKSLMALLNDVLDLSKIEAGKMEIAAVDEDFVQAMSRTRQLFQTQAEEKGLELTMAVDTNFPKALRFDPVRVRQCVSNLLSNAIKFTHAGRVEVTVFSRQLSNKNHVVSVRITDTGIGMSPEGLSRLFGVFEQADNSTTRRFGGSGLGLFISRQLARMMGGDIAVESAEGKGSTFTLTFRAEEAVLAAPVREAGPQTTRTSLRGVKVLLTDDNAINRQVIKLFLAPHGCEIVEAANGKEALDRIVAQPFDILLLDVHMPVMDGKEAIQKLRASGEAWSKLPVIALTADAMSGDRERYLALGMTDYVAKPVDQRELIAKMTAVLGLGAATPVARTGT